MTRPSLAVIVRRNTSADLVQINLKSVSAQDPSSPPALAMLRPSTRSWYATAPDGASMSFQEKCDVRNPASNQPGIVWSQRRLTTQCANPQCFKELFYLREGRLELLELAPHADDQLMPEDGAFAMRPLPSRWFWLCGGCATTYVLKRWTASGLVVLLRNQNAADSHADLAGRAANTGTTTPLPPLRIVVPMLIGQASASSARLTCAAEEASWPKARLPPKDATHNRLRKTDREHGRRSLQTEPTNGMIAG
jgi:hypothetical protein